jgi:hypothetical protein
MLALLRDRGWRRALGAQYPWTGDAVGGGGFHLRAGGTELTCAPLVTAFSSLRAPAVRRTHRRFWPWLSWRCTTAGRLFPADRQGAFERLIYPLPIAGALCAGTHYRKDLGGQAVSGPDSPSSTPKTISS